jgi:hypothetical protein
LTSDVTVSARSPEDEDVSHNDPHFEFLSWRIWLPFAVAELDTSADAQGRFVHEYIHYVQALVGTLGRIQLVELVRLAALAVLELTRGDTPGPLTERLDVLPTLTSAQPGALNGSKAQAQYGELVDELTFLLTDTPQPRVSGPAGRVVHLDRTVGANTIDSFPHVVAAFRGEFYAVPLTHRVLFENMARRIQRTFVFFASGGNTKEIDGRIGQSQLAYTCIHSALEPLVPRGEDSSRWTIALCSLAIRCRHPHRALAHVLDRLRDARPESLEAFWQQLMRDEFFAGEFNKPDLQVTLNDLVNRWGTIMRMTESWRLRELTALIAQASNDIQDDIDRFANPLLDLNDVRAWLRRYGCPPVECTDGVLTEVFGVMTTAPFHDYLAELRRILG